MTLSTSESRSSAPAPVPVGRIAHRFADLSRRGEKGLFPFVTAGDPSLEATRRYLMALAGSGADLIEIGIPFSDPLMDGPVIQAASSRALNAGTRLAGIFDLVRSVRAELEIPLIFMTCLNPIHRLGFDEFAGRSRDAGIDGILVTDLPPEEGSEWTTAAKSAGLDRVFMLAPTSSPERIAAVAESASGFIYCQSRAGVTGFREDVPPDLGDLVGRVRRSTDLPIAVGFGISRPEQARAVVDVADAAAVGTAFVRLIEERGADVEAAERAISELASSLKAATRKLEG